MQRRVKAQTCARMRGFAQTKAIARISLESAIKCRCVPDEVKPNLANICIDLHRKRDNCLRSERWAIMCRCVLDWVKPSLTHIGTDLPEKDLARINRRDVQSCAG